MFIINVVCFRFVILPFLKKITSPLHSPENKEYQRTPKANLQYPPSPGLTIAAKIWLLFEGGGWVVFRVSRLLIIIVFFEGRDWGQREQEPLI